MHALGLIGARVTAALVGAALARRSAALPTTNRKTKPRIVENDVLFKWSDVSFFQDQNRRYETWRSDTRYTDMLQQRWCSI